MSLLIAPFNAGRHNDGQLACRLNLRGCGSIRDAAVIALAGMPLLAYLDLSKCKHVSDAGAEALHDLSSLKEIFLGGTAVTLSGMEKLQTARGLQQASLCCAHLKAS